MPTLAEIRRRVHHKLASMAGLEVPENGLRGHCILLATMTMNPSGVATRTSSTDPTFVAQSDQILEHATQYFAEELGLLAEACVRVQEEAEARGLRGAALDAWCATRLHTEFIGSPIRPRGVGHAAPLTRGRAYGAARHQRIHVEHHATRSSP
jgi:hypothetical protein